MSSCERPIGTTKGKQSDTEALCQPPPPPYRPPLFCGQVPQSPRHRIQKNAVPSAPLGLEGRTRSFKVHEPMNPGTVAPPPPCPGAVVKNPMFSFSFFFFAKYSFLLSKSLRTGPNDHQPPTANRQPPPTATNRHQPPRPTARQPPPPANHCLMPLLWSCVLSMS